MANIKRFDMGPRISQSALHGNTAYVAGQVADDGIMGIEEQTANVLGKVDKQLALCGSDKSKILYLQVWLADIRDFEKMNAAYDRWVSKDNKPPRATVESKLARPHVRVEIMCIAAV
jgi:enamine deaminase RidA (YjgF/YER057c/UK114 family)